MPNVAQVLKNEIQRVARKAAKTLVDPIKKENIALRKKISQLQKMVTKLQRGHKKVAKQVLPVACQTAEEKKVIRVRPTSKSIANLRQKFGMTQGDFGKLLGVSNNTILKWEKTDGKLTMRSASLEAYADIQKLGIKDAKEKLAGIQ